MEREEPEHFIINLPGESLRDEGRQKCAGKHRCGKPAQITSPSQNHVGRPSFMSLFVKIKSFIRMKSKPDA